MRPHQIQYRLTTRRWESVEYGVYRIVGNPTTYHQQLLAPCLAGPAVASHRAAAELWQLPLAKHGYIEVTAIRWKRRHRSGTIWHESLSLNDNNTTVIDAVPTTGATRTLIDLASVLDVGSYEAALDDALRRGLTSLERLGRELERTRRFSGQGTAIVESAIAGRCGNVRIPESPLETRVLNMIEQHDLPLPENQFEIRDGRELIARVDFAWPELGVALEAQSLQFHSGRRSLERDSARRNALESLGWRVFEATATDLEHPNRLVGHLTRALVRI